MNACKIGGSGCPGNLWVKPDIYDNHPTASQISSGRGVYLVCKDTHLVRINTWTMERYSWATNWQISQFPALYLPIPKALDFLPLNILA